MEPLSQCLWLALHTEQSTVRSWLRAEEKPLVLLLLLFSFNSFWPVRLKSLRGDRELRPTVSRRQSRRRRNKPKLLYRLGLERPNVSLVRLGSPSAELEAPGETVFTLCRSS